ncbi:hypothetical protein V2J09_003265 [Rumex salicifolius]
MKSVKDSNKGEKEEAKAAENKSGEKEDVTQEVVLKVDMHCEACAKKVARSLRGFKGNDNILILISISHGARVEKVSVDCKANKVVVKAAKEVDPIHLQDRVHKKSGRKVDILSPLPLPKPESDQSEPTVVEDPPKKNETADPPPPPPPPVTTVVLQVGMHCEACAQALRRHIRKIPGVDSVQTDVANDLVTVKGVIDDPENLAQLVNKRTRKHASIVKEDNDKAKPADPKGDDQKDDTEKKKGDDNKDRGSGKGEDDTNENDLLAKFEHCPTRAYMEYYYSNAPELFSDENPNACTVM